MILLEMFGNIVQLQYIHLKILNFTLFMKIFQPQHLMVGTIWLKEEVLLALETKLLNMPDMLLEDISINSQDLDMSSLKTLFGVNNCLIKAIKLFKISWKFNTWLLNLMQTKFVK